MRYMDKGQKITLWIGIAIPIAMIIFIAGSIYIPGIFIKPQYNFIYATSGDTSYYYDRLYTVEEGKVIRRPVIAPTYGKPVTEPDFYLYDVKTDQARKLTFDEAVIYRLDASAQSPDGFTVVNGRGEYGMFPFFVGGSNYQNYYLRGKNVSRKLNLSLRANAYYSFQFLGWVTP